ncbi:HD domain-containing protein [Burkholderia territorii]|uniref:HD domain-containing protein n=1 Tax=Burkholderia territorii TaxID=1503055 RepID=UPI0009BC993C|nr:HD domain-containing protein [Burkholderia territorii]
MKILDAYRLAARLHAGQTDKVGRPYIEHLTRVFLRVCERGGSREQRIASLLHDVVEDGKATPAELLAEGVPQGAVEIIMVLTKLPHETYVEYVLRVKLHAKAVPVKHCDLEDNSDPERLALLDDDMAARLQKKYEQALSSLTT